MCTLARDVTRSAARLGSRLPPSWSSCATVHVPFLHAAAPNLPPCAQTVVIRQECYYSLRSLVTRGLRAIVRRVDIDAEGARNT